jgi:hypothetical protein
VLVYLILDKNKIKPKGERMDTKHSKKKKKKKTIKHKSNMMSNTDPPKHGGELRSSRRVGRSCFS